MSCTQAFGRVPYRKTPWHGAESLAGLQALAPPARDDGSRQRVTLRWSMCRDNSHEPGENAAPCIHHSIVSLRASLDGVWGPVALVLGQNRFEASVARISLAYLTLSFDRHQARAIVLRAGKGSPSASGEPDPCLHPSEGVHDQCGRGSPSTSHSPVRPTHGLSESSLTVVF